MKETIGNVTLNYQFYSGKDLYSDGPIEDELLKAAQNCTEDELEAFVCSEGKWEFLYHFSSIRQNIVEGLHINKTHQVLEIGAGCGAITGKLAQKADKVTCIELSQKRSLINAYRNAESGNIEILVGNFEDIEPTLTEQYDYITLIGVFEYAALYIQSQTPYVEFLTKIKKHLKPTGKIVIAIENKMGMKYWAGCVEDHTGAFFDGIQNYNNISNVRTFTKTELEKLFTDVGLSRWEFYYPHPDYKLPLDIYCDTRLPKPEELKGDYHSYDRERMMLFDEGMAYEGILQNGLYPMFANSYLVVAGLDKMLPEEMGYCHFDGKISIPEQKEYSVNKLLASVKKSEGYITLQIFWDLGEGFSEENSRIMEVKRDGEAGICFESDIPEETIAFRIDPGNDPCMVYLRVCDGDGKEYTIKETNGTVTVDGAVSFGAEDPWVVYDLKDKIGHKVKGTMTYYLRY